MNLEKKSVPVDQKLPETCPAPEKISAFLDGEETFTPEEEAHFYACPECQKRFRIYQNMGALLESALEEEMKKLPGSDRILDKIHEKLQKEYGIPYKEESREERFSFVPLRHIAGIAAVFLFLAFAFLLVMQIRQGAPENTLLAENNRRKELPAVPEEVQTFSSVEIDRLIPASAGGKPFAFTSGREAGINPVLIPFQVKQLWLIPKGTAQKDLEKLLGAKCTRKGKEWTFAKMTTRRQVVEMVRALGKNKYKLLTPVPPQPEDTHFLGTGKEKVQLLLTFLPEE